MTKTERQTALRSRLMGFLSTERIASFGDDKTQVLDAAVALFEGYSDQGLLRLCDDDILDAMTLSLTNEEGA